MKTLIKLNFLINIKPDHLYHIPESNKLARSKYNAKFNSENFDQL
jgi:hypothetical protein